MLSKLWEIMNLHAQVGGGGVLFFSCFGFLQQAALLQEGKEDVQGLSCQQDCYAVWPYICSVADNADGEPSKLLGLQGTLPPLSSTMLLAASA